MLKNFLAALFIMMLVTVAAEAQAGPPNTAVLSAM